jgi:glucan 1,3-beta-glucosidase
MHAIKGVNLGGWMVLERWITPSLFEGTKARDEFNFCKEFGGQTPAKLKKHRDEFVRKDDFKWLAKNGFNAIRIPVGYWIFGDADPYVGGIEYLDFAMQIAQDNNLRVIIDLHGAPGSQNGWKHSGREGGLNWHDNESNIALTLKTIGKLANRYKDSENLIGIELLNEPRHDVPQKTLVDFYQQGYEEVRRHCDERAAVIISDAFRPYAWQQVLLAPSYKNVWLDCHLYQVFDQQDKELSIAGHLEKTKNEWVRTIKDLQEAHPVIVGEWSMALPPKAFHSLNNEEIEQAISSYGSAQLATFSQSRAWFYWTYKTEQQSPWNARCMIEKGLLNIQRSAN